MIVLIRQDVKFRKLNLDPYNNGKLELQGFRLSSAIGDLDILNVYNPGENITTDEFIHYIRQLGNKYLILGDFNAHSQLWDARARTNRTGTTIEEIMEIFNVGVLNDFTPTYLDRQQGTASCLDLCLASANLARLGEMSRCADISSDHFPMMTTFGLMLNKTEQRTVKKWSLRKADWPEWQRLMAAANESPEIAPWDADTRSQILLDKLDSASV